MTDKILDWLDGKLGNIIVEVIVKTIMAIISAIAVWVTGFAQACYKYMSEKMTPADVFFGILAIIVFVYLYYSLRTRTTSKREAKSNEKAERLVSSFPFIIMDLAISSGAIEEKDIHDGFQDTLKFRKAADEIRRKWFTTDAMAYFRDYLDVSENTKSADKTNDLKGIGQ